MLKGNDIKDSNGNVLIGGVKVDASTPIKKAIVQTTFADANQYMKDGVLLRQVINVIDELDLSLRPYNALRKAGIHTIAGIILTTDTIIGGTITIIIGIILITDIMLRTIYRGSPQTTSRIFQLMATL